MSIEAEIKILAVGVLASLQRLESAVHGNGIRITGVETASKAITLLKQEKFDAVIIDFECGVKPEICDDLYELTKVPLALLINQTLANWKELRTWRVDGFIPEESSNIELVARIKAITRRKIYPFNLIEITYT